MSVVAVLRLVALLFFLHVAAAPSAEHDDERAASTTTTTRILRQQQYYENNKPEAAAADGASRRNNRRRGGGAGGDGETTTTRRILLDGGDDAAPARPTVSPYFQWETSMWKQRSIKANATLAVDALDAALQEASENNCDLGITATLFDADAEQVYQTTVGTKYSTLVEDGDDSPYVDGWTGSTTFALYSNSKIFAAVLFMASVVDAGRGYLDEPLSESLKGVPAYGNLTRRDGDGAATRVGTITPRMILSHRTGIRSYNRNAAGDPFYARCIFNETYSLTDCVAEFLLRDGSLLEDPGTMVRYNNDPFYILADVILQKTGAANLDDVLQEYITGPLNMSTATSYDCPLVRSTRAKPHVSWGICSTGTDAPKLIQVLANQGQTVDGTMKQIVSADSVRQILSFQVGAADSADAPIANFAVPLNNCLGRTNRELPNSLIGYGLGTMITAGVKGQHFVHAATVGGYWVIAPNKYSAYFAWMKRGSFPTQFAWMARAVDRFEVASTFQVSNAWEDDEWNEISVCVDGMFVESTTVDDAARPVACPGGTLSPTTSTDSPAAPPTSAPDTTSETPGVKCNPVSWVLQIILGWLTAWLAGFDFCDLGA